MRVAIDATPLIVSSGGVPRYTWELSQALAVNFPEDEFVLVTDQFLPGVSPPVGRLRLKAAAPRNFFERRWWLMGLEREMERLNTEVFHGTNFAVPYLA